MRKYFLEHKTSRLWLTIKGGLTNDPDNKELLTFRESFWADEWLEPMQRQYQYSFTGNSRYCLNEISISTQFMVENKLNESGMSLYSDFMVTEHEFIC